MYLKVNKKSNIYIDYAALMRLAWEKTHMPSR